MAALGWSSLFPRPPDRCRGLAGKDQRQGWRAAPSRQRRAGGAPLMVIFRGERLPGDRRTARLSCGRGAAGPFRPGTACLPVARLATGGGARGRRATAHRSRAGRRPGVAEQPRHAPAAPGDQPHAAPRTPAAHRDRPRNRAGPERPGTPAGRALETVEKLVTARKRAFRTWIGGRCSDTTSLRPNYWRRSIASQVLSSGCM
jgi:hypothetical protein